MIKVNELQSTVDSSQYSSIDKTIVLNDTISIDNIITSNNLDFLKNKSLFKKYNVLQKKMVIVTNDYTYSVTSGGSSGTTNVPVELEQMRITLKAKSDNSIFYVRHGMNGEGNTTHNWTMLVGSRHALTDWNLEVARHMNDSTTYGQTYNSWVRAFTNIGAYTDADYIKTPIQTAEAEYMLYPEIMSNTYIDFGVFVNSWNNSTTWYLNRSVSNTMGEYERGVSYSYVEEIEGPPSSYVNTTTAEYQNSSNAEYGIVEIVM